jgi:hypothetical protein
MDMTEFNQTATLAGPNGAAPWSALTDSAVFCLPATLLGLVGG